MRVSEILHNPKYTDNMELMFFHGTSTKWKESFVERGIGITKLNKKKDFGEGFYLTTNFWQAKDYAKRIAHGTRTEPLVIACTIKLGKLRQELSNGHIIDEFNTDWLKVIIRGRFDSEENPLREDFHWIYGRCGDGKTFNFEKHYRRQEQPNLESLLEHIIPSEDHPHYNFDQLWLGTKEAIKYIQSVEIINDKEGMRYEIPHHQ